MSASFLTDHRAPFSSARLPQLQVEGDGGRLPTAATCFNTLRLPACASLLTIQESGTLVDDLDDL